MGRSLQKQDARKGPQDREKAISVAYLRLLGANQTDAGSANGVSRDTVSKWESCSWWPEIQAEATNRWLSGLDAKAMRTLESEMDGPLALKVLERRMPALAPPTQKTELTGRDGKPIPTSIEVVFGVPEESDD